MKAIELSRRIEVLMKLDLESAKMSPTGTAFSPSIDLEAVKALDRVARANKLQIVDAVLAIEQDLSGVIAKHFFPNDREKRAEFSLVMLGADWCGFSNKRKLVNHIVARTQNLDGIAPDDFDKLMGKAMRYRNAFTHGTFRVNNGSVWLSYYEARPMHVELTDEYMDKLEGEIRMAQAQASKLAEFFKVHE